MKIVRTVCLILATVMLLTGCGYSDYDLPYKADASVSSYDVVFKQDRSVAGSFATNLCVVDENVISPSVEQLTEATSAILFSLKDKKVLYAKEANSIVNPASLTKVMTALVAIKNGSLNQTLTATNVVNITEKGAQLCGLKAGDTMTLDQALRILLVYSANDAAMLIADCVGGTVENFIGMMNEEANRLGATNTHFTNPHGLTDADHYTTAYDLYLILNEAMKYDTFSEIIQMSSYQTTYYDKNGKAKDFNKTTTNLFIRGDYSAPSNVTVIGGKTGTTKAAGHCLMLFCRGVNGEPYVSIIMGVPSTEGLYSGMIDLLSEIDK